MPDKPKTPRNLVTWRDTPAGGAHGIVTYGLPSPHYVEIEHGGRWAVQTLDARDKPIFVKTGVARNAAKAKRAAEDAIRLLVTGEDLDKEVKSHDPLPWVRTAKIYLGLSLACLAVLLFGRYLLLHRTLLLLRIVFWGGLSVVLAHKLIVFSFDTARRVDYLVGRKATTSPQQPTASQIRQQQQRVQQIADSRRKALPAGGRK